MSKEKTNKTPVNKEKTKVMPSMGTGAFAKRAKVAVPKQVVKSERPAAQEPKQKIDKSKSAVCKSEMVSKSKKVFKNG